MERAPLPPHERPWRHPSELAAQTSALLRAEPASSSTRAVALLGGAAGVLLIGLVVLAVTPRDGSPTTAMSVTTIGHAFGGASVSPAVLSTPTREVATLLATPVGTDGLAVLSSDALTDVTGSAAIGQRVPVRLTTGGHDGTVTGAVVHHDVDGGIAVVALVELGRTTGLPVADEAPHRDEELTVLTDPPISTTLGGLEHLDVPDGVAVVDDDGHLVGLCDDDADGFIPVDERLVVASAPAD